MTPEALESQFLSVASLLSAEVGSTNYYRGQVDGTPFLMKLVSADPPAYMIKLRMNEPRNLHSDWPASLSEEHVDANVDCEIEGDYIFFASYIVFRATGSMDIGLILQNTLPIAFGGNVMYSMLKIGFGITFGAAVFQFAKPKNAQLTL
ncbi:MAG: hypothetical protein O3A87_03525 [Verrucomicrobia bacterium]|nr:hypothetical protein [Verrucomicrobiota bacterium]MDA1005533.1 hypothetical protein [Verrucomicrobiota bacterium]